ncbi:hypothetical protein EV127DRAFT_376045 [Xylaria flabelliformis]|nr:hypothetical protein EV127DRAFT_376045 [Xylaria flabelliformis]
MPSPSSPFLKLPPELRNAIYEQYVLAEGGYVYNFELGKLCATNDPEHPVDLALIYTCTQIANEMKGIALSCNVVTFRTFSSPNLDLRASRFHEIMQESERAAADLFGSVSYAQCYKHVLDELVRVFPECQPLLQLVKAMGQTSPPLSDAAQGASITNHWKGVPSVTRELLFYAVEVALKLGCDLPEEHGILAHDLLEIQSTYMPWTIPTENETTNTIRKFNKKRWGNRQTEIGKMYPFSAASVAIKFLHHTPISTRKYLRKIVILEDRASVAFPECHAKGLIPFCVENPFLHVERRLDLWRTILCPFDYLYPTWWPVGSMSIDDLARWIVEAMDLFRAGMPEKSFSLVLDGGPDLEKSSQFFEFVQRYTMWQEAIEEACARKLLWTPPLCLIRIHLLYIREHFPTILRAMTNNESFFIRCNFNIDASWNIEQIIHQNRHCSELQWIDNYHDEWSKHDYETRYKHVKNPFQPFQRWRDFYTTEYIYPTERWRYTDESIALRLHVSRFNYPDN